MNVTPEVIERLRRLASLVSKKGNSLRNGEEKKKGLDRNGNDSGKVRDTSNGGILSDTNGGLSPEVKRTENDVPTPENKQTKGEGAIKMDMDVFRQILKEVIIKRTAAIEKRVMGDVEALKNQVFELEAQKKRLQCDSDRLQQTLNEISSNHEKQKMQMISCGTQVDMDLIQERPLSPEIFKVVKPASFSEMSITLNQMQNSKIVNNKEAVSHQVNTYKIDENAGQASDHTKAPESRIHCYDTGIGLAQNVPVANEDATKTLSAKDTTVEILKRVSSQEQRITIESLATRDQQNRLQTQTVQFPHAPSIHRPNSELRVEGPHAGQEQPNIYQRPARVDMLQHTQIHGPPPPRPIVSSGNPPIRGQNQVYFPKTSTESPLTRRPQFSSTRWLASQSQQPNQQVQVSGNGNVQPQQHPSVNNSPLERANQRSIATFPRGPPNVSLFQAPKRRRVENASASDGLHMHVVSSNSNYVMHNFKVKQTPTSRALGGEHGKKYVQISGPVSANKVVSPTTSSNQLARSYLTQVVPNSQPGVYPAQYPFHATNKAPDRPSVGPSQGQPVERVFYPSNGPQPGGNEYHNAERVLSTHHQRYNERVQATDPPAEPNGTVYVVQEYQVSRTRSAPLQAIAPAPAPAPAPPAVPRNPTCPPVQSPGITSTASPSGSRPGEANAGLIPRPVSNPSDTPAVRSGGPQLHFKTPPKPTASIVVVQDGIVLSWNMQLDEETAKIDNYELFACQDGAESTNPPIMWKKIGIVKALPLPMACTLTQFSTGNKYHFAVRAVDDQERAGPFSDPCTISLTN